MRWTENPEIVVRVHISAYKLNGPLAQFLVEHLICIQAVTGSSPVGSSIKF